MTLQILIMNEAIARLMIATSFVDGSSPASERELIQRIMDVLQIDEKMQQGLFKTAENLDDLEDFVEWCQSSILKISEKEDAGWNAISILFMALVAMADCKIVPSESRLIGAIAKELKVNIESLVLT